MTALPLNNENLTPGSIKIAETQPEDLAPAKTTKHHRLEHCTITNPATRRQQRIDLVGSHEQPGTQTSTTTTTTVA